MTAVDTNLLFAWLNRDHTRHQPAAEWMTLQSANPDSQILNQTSPMTLHELVADKLEHADPATRDALLRIPLDNIDRWITNGHTAPHRLEQWRQILLRARHSPGGFQELLTLLRDPGKAAQRLRDFAPFAGVLSRDERRSAAPECAYHF